MGLKSFDAGERTRLKFTATLELLPYPEAQSRRPYALSECPNWLLVSNLAYAGIGLDEFEVVVDKEGRGVEVLARGFRERLVRS